MFAVIIPVGPGERELTRLDSLVAELGAHESAEEIALWVVDDAPVAREITVSWPRIHVIRTQLRLRGGQPDLFSAHVAGTLEALAGVRDAGHEFAVKLDTDAAVIAGFGESLRGAFADRRLGVVGSYDRTSTGGARDWSMWPSRIRAAARPVALRRDAGRPRVVLRNRRTRAHVRAQTRAAFAHTTPGAHCLGGAYAVSGSFLSSAALDWEPWIASFLGEDVVVGLLCSAAGLDMASLTGPGEPFALAWQGLPGSPEEIAAGGHAIVHSVKGATEAAESEIRAELQRAALSARADER